MQAVCDTAVPVVWLPHKAPNGGGMILTSVSCISGCDVGKSFQKCLAFFVTPPCNGFAERMMDVFDRMKACNEDGS